MSCMNLAIGMSTKLPSNGIYTALGMDCPSNEYRIFGKLQDDSKQVCLHVSMLHCLWSVHVGNWHLLLQLDKSITSNALESAIWGISHVIINDSGYFLSVIIT